MSSIGNDEGKHFAFRPSAVGHRFRHLVTTLLLMGADVLAFAVAEWIFRFRTSEPGVIFLSDPHSGQKPIDIFFLLAAIFLAIRYIVGDYSRRGLFWDRAKSTTLTLLLVSLPGLLIVAALPDSYSGLAEVSTWVFLGIAIPVFRQLTRVGLKHLGLWKLPTALIASGERAREVYDVLNDTLSLGYDVQWLAVGETTDAPALSGKPKLLYLNNPKEIADRLAAENCHVAVVATEDMQSPGFAELVQRLMEYGITVSFIPSFKRLPLVGFTTSFFFGKDILMFQVHSNLQRAPNRFSKRMLDIIGSLAFLTLFSPAFIFIAIAIKRFDGGPVFYAQRRTGRNGRQFGCLKFRTMCTDADARIEAWKKEKPELYQEFLKSYKLVNDPRITKPGEWLRRTSLDEIPQLVNVLRGEMSLVGPRPIPEQQLREQYGSAATLYKTVRPGLTGLWQVSGRNDTTLERRVSYDEWYILNWSFWYDIVILLQTAWTVLTGKGAY